MLLGACGFALLAPAALDGGAASAAPGPGTDRTAHAQVTVAAASTARIGELAALDVAAMSTREKAAAVVMGHIPGSDPAVLRAFMSETGAGGFILMGANIPQTEGELRMITEALTLDPALPPLIGIDEEGGDVARLPWDDLASALTLKAQPAAAAERAFAGRGALVQRAGIGVNFGVVADVTPGPGDFIWRRSFGWPADDAAGRVAAAVTGEGAQAFSTLKHFPGHGAPAGDSHTSIPTTDLPYERWRAVDAVPFVAGIDAGAPIVMFGHLAYTAVDAAPASLSPEWHRILRDELGFTGAAVTDDLGMLQASGHPAYRDPVANAVAALAAGNDLLLGVMFSTPETTSAIIDGIVAAVESGAVPVARLDEAATRVHALRLQLAGAGRGMLPCADCAPVG